MRRSNLIPTLISVVALGAPLPAAAATAACASGAELEDAVAAAPISFVGTVTGEDPKAGMVLVSVDEVWSGGELAPTVSVMNLGPAPEAGPITMGERYLFIPDFPAEPFSMTCTPPVPMSDEVEALRPEGAVGTPGSAAEAPAEPPIDVGRMALPAFILIAIAVSIAAFSVKGPSRV